MLLETDWARDAPRLAAVRRAVFIDEQGVPEHMEWDADDAVSTHWLALVDGEPVGCARLLSDGWIGRMAVLPAWRGRGIGRAPWEHAVEKARSQGLRRLKVLSDPFALGFYRAVGAYGRTFLAIEIDALALPEAAA